MSNAIQPRIHHDLAFHNLPYFLPDPRRDLATERRSHTSTHLHLPTQPLTKTLHPDPQPADETHHPDPRSPQQVRPTTKYYHLPSALVNPPQLSIHPTCHECSIPNKRATTLPPPRHRHRAHEPVTPRQPDVFLFSYSTPSHNQGPRGLSPPQHVDHRACRSHVSSSEQPLSIHIHRSLQVPRGVKP